MPDYKRCHRKVCSPDPVYPGSYKPDLLSDALFDTDTYTGSAAATWLRVPGQARFPFLTTDREVFSADRATSLVAVFAFL